MIAALFSLMLSSALTAQVEVKSDHAVVLIDGHRYHWVRPGAPLRARIEQGRGKRLVIDAMRFEGPAPSKIRLKLGAKRRTIRLRGNTVAEPYFGWPTSFPVRHRYRVPRSRVLEVAADLKTAPRGVLVSVRLQARAQKRRGLTLTPPPGPDAPPKSAGKSARSARKRARRRRPAPATRSGPAVSAPGRSPEQPAASAPPTPAPKDAPRPEMVATAPRGAAPSDAPPLDQPPPDTPPLEQPPPERAAPIPEHRPLVPVGVVRPIPGMVPRSAPERSGTLHIQVVPGIALQPVGGLGLLRTAIGLRVLAGGGDRYLSRFSFGLGGDVDYSEHRARTRRFLYVGGRLRLALDVLLVDAKFIGTAWKLGVGAGAGVALGQVLVEDAFGAKNELVVGPAFRLAPFAGVGLGPGAVTVSVVADVSYDLRGVNGVVAPLSISPLLGYRFDL